VGTVLLRGGMIPENEKGIVVGPALRKLEVEFRMFGGYLR
jgi:hypothetical protein